MGFAGETCPNCQLPIAANAARRPKGARAPCFGCGWLRFGFGFTIHSSAPRPVQYAVPLQATDPGLPTPIGSARSVGTPNWASRGAALGDSALSALARASGCGARPKPAGSPSTSRARRPARPRPRAASRARGGAALTWTRAAGVGAARGRARNGCVFYLVYTASSIAEILRHQKRDF